MVLEYQGVADEHSDAPDAHVPDGTDLLVQEIREEVAHLVRHPIEELKRLEHVAADGDSPTTPLLTVMGQPCSRRALRVVLGLTSSSCG